MRRSCYLVGIGLCFWLLISGSELAVCPVIAQEGSDSSQEKENGLPTGAVAKIFSTRLWHSVPIQAVGLSADEKTAASFGNNVVRLWNLQTGKMLRQLSLNEDRGTPKQRIGGVRTSISFQGPGLLFSANGKLLMLADLSKGLYHFWETDSGKHVGSTSIPNKSMEIKPPPNVIFAPGAALPKRQLAGPMALSSDGKLAAFVACDVVHVWDVYKNEEITQIKGHRGTVTDVTFSPSASSLFTSGEDQTIRMWSIPHAKEQRVIEGHRAPIEKLAVSADGTHIGTASTDGTIAVWDVESGKQVSKATWRPQVLHTGLTDQNRRLIGIRQQVVSAVEWLQFSTDGKFVHCYYTVNTPSTSYQNWDGLVTIKRSSGDELRRRMFITKPGYYNLAQQWSATGYLSFGNGAVAIGPSGRIAVRPTSSQHLQIVSLETGENLGPTAGMDAPCIDVCLSGDTLAVTREDDNNVYLWDWKQNELKHRLNGHLAPPMLSSAFSSDGKVLVSASVNEADRTINVWDVATGKELRKIIGWDAGQPSYFNGSYRYTYPGLMKLCMSPDGKLLAFRGIDGRLRVVNWMTGEDVAQYEYSWKGEGSAAFSNDSQRLIVCDATESRLNAVAGAQMESKCRLTTIDVATGKELSSTEFIGFISSNIFMVDEHALLVCYDGVVRRVDPISGKELNSISLKMGDAAANAGAARIRALGNSTGLDQTLFVVSPDKRTCAYYSHADKTTHILELASGRNRFSLKAPQHEVTCLNYSLDGKFLVSGSQDSSVIIWNLFPTVNPKTSKLTPAELEGCWSDLATADAIHAFQTMCRLASRPAEAVEFLRARLRPAEKLEEESVDKLVSELDSDSYLTRERAQAKLIELGHSVRPALEQRLAGDLSAETRERITRVLQQFDHGRLSGDQLRAIRAVELLDHLETEAAESFLQQLARGEPHSRLTQEARHALNKPISARSVQNN